MPPSDIHVRAGAGQRLSDPWQRLPAIPHTLILYTFDLADFVNQLRTLEHTQHGEATFGDPDEQSGDEFGLTIRLSEHRGAMLEGFLADNLAARLTFELIDIDQAFIRDTLAQFAAIAEAFPVRGDITAD